MILDDPFDDPEGLPVTDRSPEPSKEQLDVSVFIQCIVQTHSTVRRQIPEVVFVIISMINMQEFQC